MERSAECPAAGEPWGCPQPFHGLIITLHKKTQTKVNTFVNELKLNEKQGKSMQDIN